MVGWHHLLDGHEPGQTSGDGQGQGSLACCCPWGREEEDPTWQLNINNNSRTCFLPSPPPKSTKSEGPMRGAAHGRRSPSALYCGPWGGCVPQRGLLSSPLLHWPHPPQALRSLLFTALGSLCPPGPDYRGQSPGGLNGWYRFSDFVTILCWIFYTRSFGEILQPSRILLFGEKSQPHEGMDASEETVSRACAVRGWASRQLLWRVAPPSGNSDEAHELLTLPDLKADPCNFTAAHRTGVTPLEILLVSFLPFQTSPFSAVPPRTWPSLQVGSSLFVPTKQIC